MAAYRRGRPRSAGRRAFWLIAALCALVFFGGRFFQLREIRVTGNQRFDAQEVIDASGLALGQSLFDVREADVRKAFEQNAYLELNSLTLRYPDSVELAVSEREGFAVGYCGGELLLFDVDGRVLERLESLPQNDALLVTGMDAPYTAPGRYVTCGSALRTKAMVAVLTALSESGQKSLVSELNVQNPDNLYLVSRTGVQVILGSDAELRQKLIWFQTVLEELNREGVTSGVLDVSSGKNAVYANR